MGELRRYKVAPFLALRDVEIFGDDEIAAMLNQASYLGLDLTPGSPVEDLTLGELEILVRDCGEAN
jgi:hypothetical protein